MESEEDLVDTSTWWSPGSWIRWSPTSMMSLAQAERKILSHIWHLLEPKFVPICKGTKQLRTIHLNTDSQGTPLVLVHGMGSGVGLWAMNLESLAQTRPVYAFDMLGFGRSSRPKFSKDATLAEMEFVESIEEWRKEMKLDSFVLLGHSLGGFLASAYTIRYPNQVQHLILVDPWGFPECPTDSGRKLPVWAKVVVAMLQPFNPLSGLRAAGPWGPRLVERLRPDLTQKFNHLYEDDTVPKYIFHTNAQLPSGEVAFKTMTLSFGWAKYPMIKRIGDIPRHVSITMMHGSRSWIDASVGYEVKYLRNGSYVDVQIIKGAGHHVYADKAEEFNQRVNQVCSKVDTALHEATAAFNLQVESTL